VFDAGVQGEWTPTFHFVIAGDLSVSYSGTNYGYYVRVGNLLFIHFLLGFTPTHSTASSDAYVGGLPYSNNLISTTLVPLILDNATFTAGYTYPVGNIGSSSKRISIEQAGSGNVRAAMNTNNFASGTAFTVAGQFFTRISGVS